MRTSYSLLTLFAAVLLTGCASTRSAGPSNGSPSYDSPRASDVEHRLRDEVRRWEGTPHEWGGITRAGADCSGFVMAVYRDAFGLRLPRTTAEQVKAGVSVRQRDLQAGDLVFFLNPSKTRHVGIFLSDGEFAHVSSSRGVMVSHLDESYWQEGYWTSRRVLTSADAVPEPVFATPAPAPTPRERPARTSTARPAEARVGW